jgi:hypothetical protein
MEKAPQGAFFYSKLNFPLSLVGRGGLGVPAIAYEGQALTPPSLRERSTRVSAAGEGLRPAPDRPVTPHPDLAV